MEPDGLDSYRIQWPHNSTGHEIIHEEVYEDGGDDDVIEEEYLVGEEIIPTNEINAISNTLDQSAAQNLIYMAQEGNMAMGDLIEEQVEQAENVDYNDQEYFECQVTEEVITDDWVQRQGEERIEIIIDSIDASRAQEAGAPVHPDDDIDVSLPTEQDEYTAQRPYPCDFCSRRFRKKANLMNHIVAHQQERPHVCHLCGARYIRKSDLIQHLKIHAYMPEEQEQAMEAERGPSKSAKRAKPMAGPGRGGLGKSKPSFDELIEQDVKVMYEVTNKAPSQHDNYTRQPQTERYPITDPRKPFVCQQCGLSFAREKAYLSHSKTHALETQYECEHCGETFYDMALLREHEYSHTSIIEYEDVDVGMPATSSSSRRRQQQQDTEEDDVDFDDEDADGTYLQPAATDDIEEDDGEEMDDARDEDYRDDGGHRQLRYHCDHCGMSFQRVNLLRDHVKTHLRSISRRSKDPLAGSEGHHSCDVCDSTFESPLDLLNHAETHSVKCQLCGEGKTGPLALHRHVQAVHKHELSSTICGYCGKHCRDTKAMQKHKLEHEEKMQPQKGGIGNKSSGQQMQSNSTKLGGNSGKATCYLCNKTFQNKARLKRHFLSHRKRSVQCDLCLEEFPDGRSLMNHRHSHAAGQGKKFPCKECGKSFGSRSSQQIHVRTHTGERPYGCRFCWKSFADGGTLRKHERIHTGEKPYGCVMCPRAFNQRVVLREHIRSHHGGPDPNRTNMTLPFYCQLCHNGYHRSEDLISDLIAHCDENTKRQRPIQVGPRKYKRRRKLKPHELKLLVDNNNMDEPRVELSEEDNLIDSDACTEDAVPETKPMRSTSGKRRNMDSEEYYANSGGIVYLPEAFGEETEEDEEEVEEQPQIKKEPVPVPPPVYRVSYVRATKSRAAASEAALNSSGRPKMIHTEKSRVAQSDGKRKTATLVTRSSHVSATPPPPLRPISTRRSAAAATTTTTTTTRKIYDEGAFVASIKPPPQIMEDDPTGPGLVMSSTDLAGVLENKKKNSDKYSVDIVNDLESILCSPIRPRVSESSATGGQDFNLSGLVVEEEEEEDGGEEEEVTPQISARRNTILEKRTYLPGERSRKPSMSQQQQGKQYTAKITATGSSTSRAGANSEYGIVMVRGGGSGSGSRAPIKRTTVASRGGGNSTTEDEMETLDDFMHSGGGMDERPVKKERVEECSKCEICNIVMEDKYALMKHAKTHF